MPKVPFLNGPSYSLDSVNIECQRSMNLYPSLIESGAGKDKYALIGTPGLSLFTVLPESPIRGLWPGEYRLFVAAGSHLYEVFANGTYNNRGSIGNDGLPVTIVPNGSQLGIVSAGKFYCDSGAGPVAIQFTGTSDNVTATSLAFMDGYFIVSGKTVTGSQTFGPKQFNLSALLDGTSWDPLDFAVKEGYPDNLACVLADHEELWLFGDEESTEVWQDTGNANFPFQRDPGAFIHYGCASPGTVTRLNDGVAWISGDLERGTPIAVYAQAFRPNRISNHAIEYAWSQYPQVSDAVGFVYFENGHHFWVITFPSANGGLGATWCYDATTGMWHERGYWSGTANVRQRQMFHAYVSLNVSSSAPLTPLSGQHFVGDWQNGNIYIQSQNTFNDAGNLIHRIRTCPHINNENLRVFFHDFELMAKIGPANVLNPTLDYSKDFGNTFVNPQQISSNQPGVTNQFSTRMRWRRLGASRDRVFRLTITDSVQVNLVDAYYTATPGMS